MTFFLQISPEHGLGDGRPRNQLEVLVRCGLDVATVLDHDQALGECRTEVAADHLLAIGLAHPINTAGRIEKKNKKALKDMG